MKRGTLLHPKVMELAAVLKITRIHAVGYLEQLFHFTAQYAPQGNIGKFSDKRIAAAFDWGSRRSPSILLDALVTSGWLHRDSTHRYIVHDWCDHADTSVRTRLSKAGLSFVCFTPISLDVPPLPALPLPSLSLPLPSRINGWTPTRWNEFSALYPKNCFDSDAQIYISVLSNQTEEDLLIANARLWVAHWDGKFVPSAKNFLLNRMWKQAPKPVAKKLSRLEQMALDSMKEMTDEERVSDDTDHAHERP